MANMMKMAQQALAMRSKMKHMQKELARQTVEVKSNNGKVTVVARGDMTLKSVTIAPGAWQELSHERMEKLIEQTANAALNAAKKTAGGEMSKMAGGLGGLSDLLGGMK